MSGVTGTGAALAPAVADVVREALRIELVAHATGAPWDADGIARVPTTDGLVVWRTDPSAGAPQAAIAALVGPSVAGPAGSHPLSWWVGPDDPAALPAALAAADFGRTSVETGMVADEAVLETGGRAALDGPRDVRVASVEPGAPPFEPWLAIQQAVFGWSPGCVAARRRAWTPDQPPRTVRLELLAAEDPTGVVGTALIAWDGRMGCLGGVAVPVAHRGRGIGRALSGHAMARLAEHGVSAAGLLATPAGEGIYRALGWRAVATFTQWRRPATGVSGVGC